MSTCRPQRKASNPEAELLFWIVPENVVIAAGSLPTASVVPPNELSTVPSPCRPLMLVKCPAKSRTAGERNGYIAEPGP